MIDQNLLNFVRKQVENGVSRDLAVNALLQNGWKITDINNAYMMVEQVFANKQSAPIAPQAQFQQVQQTQQAPEKFVQNKPTQNPNQQGMGLFMKIAVFIIILIFIVGIGLFVYLKFFDGSNLIKSLGARFGIQSIDTESLLSTSPVPEDSTLEIAKNNIMATSTPAKAVVNSQKVDLFSIYDKYNSALKNADVTEFNKYSYIPLKKEEESKFKMVAALLYSMGVVDKNAVTTKWEDENQAIYLTDIKKSEDAKFYKNEYGRIVFIKEGMQWKVGEVAGSIGLNVTKSVSKESAEKMLQEMSLDTDQDGIRDQVEKCEGSKAADPKCVKTDPNNRDTDGNGYWDGVDAIINSK